MSEDYFDFVGINSDTIILFGRRADGAEFHRELTAEERERVYDLTARHDQQRERLLRELSTPSPEAGE
jgi:hypothetical protein